MLRFSEQLKNRISPETSAMLDEIEQAISQNRLSDDMARDIKGYLKTKNPGYSPEQQQKHYAELKKKLTADQDECQNGNSGTNSDC